MNRLKKIALKALTYHSINLKKYYKLHRKVLTFINPYVKPLYNLLDTKIMVEDREIPVRIFVPKSHKLDKVLIFFHGGGWVTGNIDSYTKVCAHLANQTEHTVVYVDYRLAPEHPFPAGVEDCYHVTREIYLNSALFHCEQEDITLVGDSAGGNLAAAVSLMARDRGEFMPTKQILIYPSTNSDYSEKSPFHSVQKNGTDYILTSKRLQDYMELYVQKDEDMSNPYVAPILSQDLTKQPSTLIITAQYDPLRDEGEAYGLRLKKAGNPTKIYQMEDAVHGFFALPWNTEHVIKCYKIINEFLCEKEDRIENML